MAEDNSNILDAGATFGQGFGATVGNILAEDEDLKRSDLFPALDQRTNVGSFSGSEIGSFSLHTAVSDIVPIGITQKRSQAIAKAAQKQIKSKAAGKIALDVSPIKAAEQYNRFVGEAQLTNVENKRKEHLNNASKVKNDPEYNGITIL